VKGVDILAEEKDILLEEEKPKKNYYGRSTVYNNITTPEKMVQVSPENLELEKDFLEYLRSIGRADSTIYQYEHNLHVFWCWNLEYNNNKFFVDLKKREYSKFQNHCINVWGWSPKRTRTVKATLSSMSNFIEDILDDEYEDYRPIVRKIESPADEFVREKTILEREDVDKLLETLCEKKKYMQACLVALAVYSGRRKQELLRFKTEYFKDENLICNGALYKTPEKIRTKGRGQRGKMLDVYTLAKQFKPYLDLWIEQRAEIGIESEWLFPRRENSEEPLAIESLDAYTKSYSNILEKPVYFHSFRHWFVTMLLEQNLPESVVQDIVGWTSSDMVNYLPTALVTSRRNLSNCWEPLRVA